jgi:Protein of unknown function (DUF3025)
MRFSPPAREKVALTTFDHPIFSGHRPWRDLLERHAWPSVEEVDRRLQPMAHGLTGLPLGLVEQTPSLLDELHYERRIHSYGRIATRPDNWHDLFNALAWKRCPQIKSALNQRQIGDLARVGVRQRTRTRAQHALTHFDEAGIVVVIRDTTLLTAWDAHDWRGLFLDHRAAWRDGGVRSLMIGHAVLEHALDPAMWLVAKALVFDASAWPDAELDDETIDARAGAAIADGTWLQDPQELRPLPLSGIPGWRDLPQDAAFYRDAPCFQPRREGRSYPAPLAWRIHR